MKLLLKTLLTIVLLLLAAYLSLPTPSFPEPPPGVRISYEPADTETPLRHAYYTDMTREEVMDYYVRKFSQHPWGIPLPIFRFNYQIEAAQTIIRDQTRSSFLEEVGHWWRESAYINGYTPPEKEGPHLIDGKIWHQKVTVRYVPSSVFVRLGLASLALIALFVVLREWKITLRGWKK